MRAATFHQNATIIPPNFPDRLPVTTPPSALQLYDSISPAVLWGLYRIVTEGVRHEKNTYGYFDAAFHSVFPVSQRFQTNPQYPSRPAVEVGAAPHGQNISIGSLGELHGARGTFREDGMRFVDFLITKPFPRPISAPRVNNALAVIEIKTALNATKDILKFNASVDDALLQLMDYCDRLSQGAFARTDQTRVIPGYLVFGNWYTQVKKNNGVWEMDPWQFVFEEMVSNEGRAPFLYRLCELAVTHWVLDS